MSSKVRGVRKDLIPRSRRIFSEGAVRFLLEALEFTVERVHGPITDPWRRVAAWLSEQTLELTDLSVLAAKGDLPRSIRNAVRAAGGLSAFNRHVDGEHLCDGIRVLALQRWGFMARTVLAHWGVRSTHDIGELVFSLIASGRLQKQPHDRLDDFDDLYDFAEAFDRSFRIDAHEREAADPEPCQ